MNLNGDVTVKLEIDGKTKTMTVDGADFTIEEDDIYKHPDGEPYRAIMFRKSIYNESGDVVVEIVKQVAISNGQIETETASAEGGTCRIIDDALEPSNVGEQDFNMDAA